LTLGCAIFVLSACVQGQVSGRATDSQPIPDQIKIPDAPKTARDFKCFKDITAKMTMIEVVRRCGIPDEHVGSGVYIFVYHLKDGSVVSISTPNLKRIYGMTHSPSAAPLVRR
jgi:hypothetical protein